MNADLFIKAVLFLHRYLSSCSAAQLRMVKHFIYYKMLDVSQESDEHMLYGHMYDWLLPANAYGNGYFLPRLEVEYIVNMLIMVDRFYRNASYDAIDQAVQKLEDMFINNKSEYDKYAEFFGSYSRYYGDYSRRRCLLRNSVAEED